MTRFSDFDKMAGRTAILITHGTDTLAWTHAALRYAIKNNNLNIAITGSQIPMPQGVGDFSDAYANIGGSIRFLTELPAPHIFTVFNNGENAFSDSLNKVNRWDNKAFDGDVLGMMRWNDLRTDTEDAVPSTPLDTLYVITTGGTIESDYNDGGSLSPQQNRLTEFIRSKLSGQQTDVRYKSAFTIDSSDLTFQRIAMIADKVGECFREVDPDTAFYTDLQFDRNVRIVYTDPFKCEAQYEREIEGASAVVIAGYGGGNVNIDEGCGFSPMPLIRKIAGGIPVVLTSQVALGPADFIYKNADSAIRLGAISGVGLSLPEIQTRLAYIMGHISMIRDAFPAENVVGVVEKLFLAGVRFRTQQSRQKYEALRGVRFLRNDILTNISFADTLSELAK